MSTIKDIHNPWRDAIQPASFDGKEFFVEIGAYECGQRIVIHEFPKKDEPYTEMMGRRYYGYTVRGYCISSAKEPDYRKKRDALQQRLEKSDPGNLVLPFMNTQPKHVICRQFRLTEERMLGGYCTFDMQFVEASTPPFKPTPAPDYLLLQAADTLQARTLQIMAGAV
jgi:prophage DNA circulation protein